MHHYRPHFSIIFIIAHAYGQDEANSEAMIVEWIRFKVAPNYRERFVQIDHDVWTAFLTTCPGFIRKEVWISPDEPSEVILAIHWATLAQQQAIAPADLDKTDQQFITKLGVPFQLLDIKLYQLRKTTTLPLSPNRP